MRQIQNLFIVIAAIGLLVLGYMYYQRKKTTVEALHSYLDAGTSVPAMICALEEDSRAAIKGKMYIWGRSFSGEWIQNANGLVRRLFAVSADGETFYVWVGDAGNAERIERAQLSSFIDLSSASWRCSPWWLRSSSKFEIPRTVELNT